MKIEEYKFKILKPATVHALVDGGLRYIYIQFFDTLSGAAQVLNRTKNPVKAANTMMENPNEIKTGNKKSYAEMFNTFLERRVERNNSAAEIPEELDQILDSFRKQDIAPPHDPVNNEEPEVTEDFDE